MSSRTLNVRTLISRKCKWLLGSGALLLTQFAFAIGLGELRLNSAMDQLLDAEIELLQVGDLNAQQIAASLAAPADFERAGVDRDFQLVGLRFQVDLSDAQRPVIRIASRRPIREPYLNFLLELRWPSGRLLREYTVLLDLPVFAGAPATGKIRAAAPPAAAEQFTQTPTPPPASQPAAAARVASAPVVAPDGRIQVRAGDTLWAIAQRHRPPSASVQQAMQAIAKVNPEAFIQGDVNRIRRGAWLQMPDAATMSAAAPLSLASATPAPPATSPSPVESRSTPQPAPATGAGGELRLAAVVGDAGESALGGRSTEGAGGTAAVAGALEERDRLQRENDELRDRVRNLEEQLAASSRLAEIEAPVLAGLQETGESGVSATDSEETPPEPEALSEGEVSTGLESDSGIAASPSPELPAEIAEAADAEVTDAKVTDAETQDADKDAEVAASPLAALERFSQWAIPVLGAIAILGLALLVFAARRRHSKAQQQGLTLPGDEVLAPRAVPDVAVSSEATDDELFAQPQEVSEIEGVLAEAEVYLSFGDEAQAEELLRETLALEPESARLHLKLLEVLAARNDRQGFDEHLPKLAALGDLDAFATAQELLGRFVSAPATAPDQLEDDGDELALAAAPVVAPSAPEPPVPEEPRADGGAPVEEIPLDEFDLNLELDLPEEATLAETPEPVTVSDAAMVGEIDLQNVDLQDTDLEDFDLGLESVETALTPATDALAVPDELEDLGEDLHLADIDLAGMETKVAGGETGTAEAADLGFDDLDLFEPGQELATQLELAQAYIDMGDLEGAREILDHVAMAGDEPLRATAQELLAKLG